MTLRDTRVIAKLTAIFANCEKLPAEMSGFVSFMENELRSIEQKLSAEFDLSPVWRAIRWDNNRWVESPVTVHSHTIAAAEIRDAIPSLRTSAESYTTAILPEVSVLSY